MPIAPEHRNVLRLAALSTTAIASSSMIAVGGPVAYTLAAVAAILVAVVLATAERDTLRLVAFRFRLEALLGAAAIVGILVTTFLRLPASMGRVLLPVTGLLTAAFLVALSLRMFRMLCEAPRAR